MEKGICRKDGCRGKETNAVMFNRHHDLSLTQKKGAGNSALGIFSDRDEFLRIVC